MLIGLEARRDERTRRRRSGRCDRLLSLHRHATSSTLLRLLSTYFQCTTHQSGNDLRSHSCMVPGLHGRKVLVYAIVAYAYPFSKRLGFFWLSCKSWVVKFAWSLKIILNIFHLTVAIIYSNIWSFVKKKVREKVQSCLCRYSEIFTCIKWFS